MSLLMSNADTQCIMRFQMLFRNQTVINKQQTSNNLLLISLCFLFAKTVSTKYSHC